MENKKRWMVTAKRADFKSVAQKFHIDQVTARCLRNRDLITEEEIGLYLNGTLEDLYDGRQMLDMEKTADILEVKIREGKKIRIMGDYDADGIMSSYILLKGFRRLGAEADVTIPDRLTQGYGIHETLVREARADGVDTIVTCDNGIAATEQIALAKELGMTVLVTDHHAVPLDENGKEILPPADAVVNPHREDCPYPFKDLCGAGVAFKLICVLFGRRGIPEWKEYVPYAAIATVTDVMDLRDENRILVKEGLKMLRRTDNTGLRALMKANMVDPAHLSAYHIGFVLGPCLNASGRLDTAQYALKLLTREDENEAEKIAKDLVDLNVSRKSMTEQGVAQAIAQIESSELENDAVLVVYLPTCHESIAGIIAGRLRERYYRPAIVLTDSETGVKGSGRSIGEYSMFEKLSECRELMSKFGGHPMAAGLSLPGENIEAFRRKLNENCGLTGEDLTEKIHIDVPMPIAYVTMDLIRELEILEPFGKGNTKPVFAEKGIRVLGKRIVGKNRNVMKLQLLTATGCRADAVYFGDVQEFGRFLQKHDEISILYYPRINAFRGEETIEIQINDYC